MIVFISVAPVRKSSQSLTSVLEELVSALMTSLTPVTTPSSASVSPMALPASYAGDAAVCGGFLLQVDLFIEMQPQKFTTERSKVAFLISLLNGNALEWARATWNAVRSSTTREYTLQFRTLAATSGWNEAALLSAYRQGLDPPLRYPPNRTRNIDFIPAASATANPKPLGFSPHRLGLFEQFHIL
uniref:DUF4939 domain-containing protein n=1 Tax=Sinocyclocheilus anshuiensis TaxID=1608454 RepID=A0A671T566_9TELE